MYEVKLTLRSGAETVCNCTDTPFARRGAAVPARDDLVLREAART